MMSQEDARKLIQEVLNSLSRSGLIAGEVTALMDTILLGRGSPLDSIAFVTFMTDLEDRLYQKVSSDSSVFAMVLQDIHEFNPDDAHLTVGTLARYIVELVEKQGNSAGGSTIPT